MTEEELNEVLKEHERWLRTRFDLNPEGSRADLRYACLLYTSPSPRDS